MILGKIIGNVVSIIKDESYIGFKLMVVQEMNIDGSLEDNIYVSVDLIGVGVDETVLITNGTASRATEETYEKPIDSVIVAIINKLIFDHGDLEL